MPSAKRPSKYSKAQIEAMKKRRENREKKAQDKRGKWHWFLTVMVVGFVLGIVSFTFIVPNVLISWFEIVLIILGVSALASIVQYTYFKRKSIITDNLKITNGLYLGYNIIGVGFLSFFLLLILNSTVGTQKITETHRIIGVDPEYKIYRWGSVVFLLEDDAFSSEEDLRALPYKFYYKYEDNPFIEYEFIEGLFGYRIKSSHRLARVKDRE